MTEQPVYLVDLTLSAFAPEPVEPPPVPVSLLDMQDSTPEDSRLDMKPVTGGFNVKAVEQQ